MREALSATKKFTVSVFDKYLKLTRFMSSHHLGFMFLMTAIWLIFMLPVALGKSYAPINRVIASISSISVLVVYFYEELSHSKYRFRICLCALLIGIATFLQVALSVGII